jgi:2-polyprenyl-3-methyl-5-hydroxy-6-metoxy-1,4-benzoquinol methylase
MSALYSGSSYFVKSCDTDKELICGYPGNYLENSANVELKFSQVLGHIERYTRPGRLLDVGAGPGFLVKVAQERGWEATGLDINDWAVSYGQEMLNLDIRAGVISDNEFEDGEFNAVTMMDLIEHLPAPHEAIEDVAKATGIDGCVAILTPDAGSLPTRLLGSRWPEVRRPGEHVVLFSVDGLARLLDRYGLAACGWHSIGKAASVRTLLADVSPAAPGLMSRLAGIIEDRAISQRVIDFDPRTKFCLYARRVSTARRAPAHPPARIEKEPERQSSVEGAIIDELGHLANAERYCDWLFSQFSGFVKGSVAEVGAGIGTFSQRILDQGANRLLLIEPEPTCAGALEQRFASSDRVVLSRDALPTAPSLVADEFDLVVCQNVLEHITDDEGALATMASSLRVGGVLALIVPAIPRLFGPLDEAYGHRRRYAHGDVADSIESAGLRVRSLRYLNAPGIAAWWLKNLRAGARVGPDSLKAYEHVVMIERPLEERFKPRRGLSLVCIAERPHEA